MQYLALIFLLNQIRSLGCSIFRSEIFQISIVGFQTTVKPMSCLVLRLILSRNSTVSGTIFDLTL